MKKLNILITSVPADGHFKPLTGIAKYLQDCGHDVRWYVSSKYVPYLTEMGMHYYIFKQAKDIHASDLDIHFPERKKIMNPITKLNFDIEHFFVKRGSEYMEDIRAIQMMFPIDIVICDLAFSGIPYLQDVLHLPVLSVSVFPFPGTTRGLPPYGFGLTPASNSLQRVGHAILGWLARNLLFKKSNRVMHKLLEAYNVRHDNADVFNIGTNKSDKVLQSGSPSFDYERIGLDSRVQFAGAILPAKKDGRTKPQSYPKLDSYNRVILVTQGTVEKDNSKLVIPALEAFKNDKDTYVVCTTGGSDTEELRRKYNYPHFLIEDFIPFEDIMPYVDVFISNGGYGGVMLSIQHGVPMVVAGIHEGKNEICARIGYLGYGINLGTERPRSTQIAKATLRILNDNVFRSNVESLRKEMEAYNPSSYLAECIDEILSKRSVERVTPRYTNKPVHDSATV